MPKKFLVDIISEDPSLIEIAKNDPRLIIENMFSIPDKSGKVVPFKLNGPQTNYYENMTARDDILKARQQGFSSLIMAIWTVRFLFLSNRKSVSISHEDEATKRLFQKVQFYIDTLKTPSGLPISVELDSKSTKRLEYVKEVNGVPYKTEFFIGTAGAKSFGRGDTIHDLHASEHAFWPDISKLLTGLVQAVPRDFDNTQITKESTANGAGTAHSEAWDKAVEGESAYKPHFFGWNAMEEYRMPVGPDFQATTEEKKLMAEHGLDKEQIAWRRYSISEQQGSENASQEDLFKQEFPLTPQEAFLSSGNPIFNKVDLAFYDQNYVREPDKVGDLHGMGKPLLVPNKEGRVKIWEMPVAGRGYVIGADVGTETDYSYAFVMDNATKTQVAEYHAKTPTFEFAQELFKLGMFYNKALLGPERNNHGVAVVNKLQEMNYPNLYTRKREGKKYEATIDEFGFHTNLSTRPLIISELNQTIGLRELVIRSKLVLQELYTFVRDDKGRAAAQPGAHDDAVLGAAITWYIGKDAPSESTTAQIVSRNYKPNSSLNNLITKRNGNTSRRQKRK